jgi:hypothetical protein
MVGQEEKIPPFKSQQLQVGSTLRILQAVKVHNPLIPSSITSNVTFSAFVHAIAINPIIFKSDG